MGLKTILIVILFFCIALIGFAFYVEHFYTPDMLTEHPTQDIQQDIIHLETFKIPGGVAGSARIVIIHDDKRNVTCYLYNRMSCGGGISCIPDSEIQPPEIDNNYKRYIAR